MILTKKFKFIFFDLIYIKKTKKLFLCSYYFMLFVIIKCSDYKKIKKNKLNTTPLVDLSIITVIPTSSSNPLSEPDIYQQLLPSIISIIVGPFIYLPQMFSRSIDPDVTLLFWKKFFFKNCVKPPKITAQNILLLHLSTPIQTNTTTKSFHQLYKIWISCM